LLIAGVDDIAAFTNRSRRATYHLVKSGRLAGVKKIGGIWTMHVPTFLRETFGAEAAA
jgi:hypothetical protein